MDVFQRQQLFMSFYMVWCDLYTYILVIIFLKILFSALGFYHMQSTYDRDDYVIINWENIEDGTSHNFNKYTSSQVTNFGVPYDPYSIMHYFSTAFSKNGKPTIVKRVSTLF